MLVSMGPAGFHKKSLRRALAQCRGVVVVACEPLPEAYGAAAATAVGLGAHAAIIETRPRHEADWLAFIKDVAPEAAVMIATVRPAGDVH